MKEQLIPSLEKDDVVIMDNMRSHHAKIVTELLDKAGNIFAGFLAVFVCHIERLLIADTMDNFQIFVRKGKVAVVFLGKLADCRGQVLYEATLQHFQFLI